MEAFLFELLIAAVLLLLLTAVLWHQEKRLREEAEVRRAGRRAMRRMDRDFYDKQRLKIDQVVKDLEENRFQLSSLGKKS